MITHPDSYDPALTIVLRVGILIGVAGTIGAIAPIVTPADLLIMSRALAKLGAQNTAVFIALAAEVGSRNVAFYQRSHAELLAAHSTELGGIARFITVAGRVVAVTRSGNVVAAFTFDGLVWTPVPQRTFREVTAELPRGAGPPVFATTGAVTPMAAAEIGKLGWKVVHLKPPH